MYCYLRQEILRSVVFVGWLVRLFVNMCVHREFVNSLASRRRDERRSGVAGARATCSRTYLGISGRGVRALKYPVSIQAATKDVRKKISGGNGFAAYTSALAVVLSYSFLSLGFIR